jgi:hypothetical protein
MKGGHVDNFLHLTDEPREKNKKTDSLLTHVDKERIQRLKRSFLPFWMRGMGEQTQNRNESILKRNPAEQL